MNEEDKKQLELLRTRAIEAVEILRIEGADDLADNLLLNVGYAVGLAYRLDKERQEAEDRILGALV